MTAQHTAVRMLGDGTDGEFRSEVPSTAIRHGDRGNDATGQWMVYRRLKASYGPTYLTILSVIQAVAMGDLAQVVADGHAHFTLVQWLLTVNTFGVLIII